jgi:pimeloyl-ACP methyl ester carboxylesterase
MTHRPETLARPEGATIAYRRLAGRSPGVIFLGGFHSDKTGTKGCSSRIIAGAVAPLCASDYFGHGASSGDAADGTIGRWVGDAIAVLDGLARGPQILVGSSMGGWIMLPAALSRRERVQAVVRIGAARLDPAPREAPTAEGSVTLFSQCDPV